MSARASDDDRGATARQRLGAHIRRGRLALRLQQVVLADRAGISVQTLRSLERGDPGVTLAIVFRVLDQLGIADAVADAADPTSTPVGQQRSADLERQRAPRRL